MSQIQQIKYLIIHHSWSEDSKKTLNAPAIMNYHVKVKKMRKVGYNELIEEYRKKVLSVNGRPAYIQGAHTLGFNTKSYGICVIGNFDKKTPSPEVWIKALERAKVICLTYGISVENVLGHRETFALRGRAQEKTCPGKKFNMDKFRQALKNILKK